VIAVAADMERETMPDLMDLLSLLPKIIPMECMESGFVQRALFGLVLLAPMAACMGVQVVNFRMAFFADAISHSAFAGVAIGLLFAANPHWTMLVLGLLVGLSIMAVQRRSSLSSDTVIGVFFSAVIAFGLTVVSHYKNVARDVNQFLYGGITTIDTTELWELMALFVVLMAFQVWGYNRMLYIGMNPSLAQVHRVRVAIYQYLYAALLALVVIFSVWAVGVLLVTAMLIVPAASARNFSRTAGGMVWWAMAISVFSAVAGLLISTQPWADTATGATVILIAFLCFLISAGVAYLRGDSSR